MEESSKRIKALVEEVMAEARDTVRLEDLDAGSPISVTMSYRYGAVTLRVGDSFTLNVTPDDALELASALQAIAATGKRDR